MSFRIGIQDNITAISYQRSCAIIPHNHTGTSHVDQLPAQVNRILHRLLTTAKTDNP